MGASVVALADCEPPGYGGTKVGLDTLYVVTQMDYNSSFHSGDTINRIVYFGTFNYDLGSLDDFMIQSQDNITGWGIDIVLTEPPSNQNTACQFKFSMILKDGSKFEATGSEVTLTR